MHTNKEPRMLEKKYISKEKLFKQKKKKKNKKMGGKILSSFGNPPNSMPSCSSMSLEVYIPLFQWFSQPRLFLFFLIYT